VRLCYLVICNVPPLQVVVSTGHAASPAVGYEHRQLAQHGERRVEQGNGGPAVRGFQPVVCHRYRVVRAFDVGINSERQKFVALCRADTGIINSATLTGLTAYAKQVREKVARSSQLRTSTADHGLLFCRPFTIGSATLLIPSSQQSAASTMLRCPRFPATLVDPRV
jgi:hypothetical protein